MVFKQPKGKRICVSSRVNIIDLHFQDLTSYRAIEDSFGEVRYLTDTT